MQSLHIPRKKRATQVKLGGILQGSKRRQRDFRPLTLRSESTQEPGTVDLLPEDTDFDLDQPNSDFLLPESLEESILPSSAKEGSHQAHGVRKQNEEENYRAYRPEALRAFTTASCRQTMAEKYCKLAELTRDFSRRCAENACCRGCGLRATLCGEPVGGVPVNLVSITCFVELHVPIYRCTRCPESEAIFHADPLRCGAFPGSPVHAAQHVQLLSGAQSRHRVWFTIELLDLLSHLRKHNAHIATESFVVSLFEMHERGCGSNLASRTVARRQLGKAVEEYEIMLHMEEEEVLSVCQDRNPMGSCAACSKDIDATVGEAEPQAEDNPQEVISCQLFGDGNFRLPHFTKAGSSTVHEPPIKERILDDSVVQDFCSQPSSGIVAEEKNQCNDFNADKQLGREKARFDITDPVRESRLLGKRIDGTYPNNESAGLYAAFCRHGVLICALNMVTGEKWSYSTCLLYSLMLSKVVPSVWWYDINCRYKGHFLRWLEQSDLPEAVKDKARAMQFPLPSWHHGMHNAQCQNLNSYRRMEGLGSGVGEPPEQAWAHLGPYGYILQYHSLPSRQSYLERIIAHWNAAKLERLPQGLTDMFERALYEQQAALDTCQALTEYAANVLHLTDEQVMEAAGQVVPDSTSTGQEPLEWQGAYVALLLELDFLQKAQESRLPPALLTGTLTGTARLDPVTRKLKVVRLIEAHEEAQAISDRWQIGEPDFESGFSTLCDYHIRGSQLRISALVQEYLLLVELFERIQTRRGETKRLEKTRQRQKSKITSAIQLWRDWQSVQQGSSASSGQSSLAELLPAFLRAEYPWHAREHEGAIEVLQAKMGLQLDLVSRNQEEMVMVVEEAGNAAATIQRQLLRLQEKLQEWIMLLQEVSAEEAGAATGSGEAHDDPELDYAIEAEARRCKLDGLQGWKERLANKMKQLSILGDELSRTQLFLSERFKAISQGQQLGTDELATAIETHACLGIEAEYEGDEQNWLEQNRAQP